MIKVSTRNGIIRIWILFGLIAAFWVGEYLIQFIPAPARERQFLQKIETAFADKETDILIANLTDFDWDYVCLSHSDGLGHTVSTEITKDENERKKIAKSNVSLAFFKDKKLNNLYGYKGWEKITINAQKYQFARFEDKGCVDKQKAIFRAKTKLTDQWGPIRTIVLTSKEN